MWFSVILLFIAASFSAFLSFSYYKKAKNTNNDEQQRASDKTGSIALLVLAIAITAGNIFYCIPQAINFEPVKVTSSNRKEKCGWCGKMTPEDEMQGDLCEDCQNDAFGKDGWYHDIKD